MKSLKYTLIMGVLCAGMASLAHATLTGPVLVDTGSSGDAAELAAFIAAFPEHSDATLCVKLEVDDPFSSGLPPQTITNSFGNFTFTFLDQNASGLFEVQVDFTMNPGNVVCGFLTKDGGGTDEVFLFGVSEDQGEANTFILQVPHGGELSHIDVFCCPGGNGVPDGGATVMLLGAALGSLGMARRFLKR
jgi:hypothetical protein